MGAGQLVLVEGFAVGRGFGMEARTVPGGDAGLVIAEVFLGIIPDTLDLIGFADLVAGGGAGLSLDGCLFPRSGFRASCQSQNGHGNQQTICQRPGHRFAGDDIPGHNFPGHPDFPLKAERNYPIYS